MTAVTAALKAARKKYDSKKSTAATEAEFSAAVDAAYAQLKNVSDADKIAAFDRIADFFINHYRNTELEGGTQYIKSDLDTYLSEVAMTAVVGKDFFDFYNVTYEAG